MGLPGFVRVLGDRLVQSAGRALAGGRKHTSETSKSELLPTDAGSQRALRQSLAEPSGHILQQEVPNVDVLADR